MTTLIPQHVVTADSTASPWKLRCQFPGKYHLTVQRGGWITRYYSDKPSIAVSEAWADKLSRASEPEAQEESPSSWCLIDSSEKDVVFFMSVRGGVVREARSLPFDELDRLKLKLGDVVYIAPGFVHHFPDQDITTWGCQNVEFVSALEPHERQAYQLKPNRLTAMVLLGAGVLLAGAVSSGLWLAHQQEAPKQAVQQVVDDYQAYRSSMRNGLSAGEGMEHLLSLTAKGTLAPFGWTLDNVTLKGHDMVATINRDDTGLIATAKGWLQLKGLTDQAVMNIDSLTLKEPMQASLSEWVDEIAPYEVSEKLLDILIKLGWNANGSKRNDLKYTTVLDMKLKKASVTLGEFQSLATMFNPLPISLEALKLTPNGDGTYRVDMHIKFTGEVS
ncbi:hypothetical protein I6Y99_004592 [Vibrio parahaemolyticus]|uniref:hypothetical protein n=1 Tax=Vibrio parahaemolyticus TaxID=670 RepID=UPI001A2D5BB5|nr:hypothetical protein [Vibrio parahaemolyticus]EGQ7795971.1 hypothetical protein [Vibrio parahaemolyticus]EGQ7810548.1 hypothetical protein [Vibrio parahaemolyticus]EHR5321375.1 hypothetical protein [Vibrio parahaemolyticus]EJB8691220.1 hypothetical protein [Vibrio parahaemolyticus]MCR9780658.1 hypothetical protein [Vibrio parahaemolyticus]